MANITKLEFIALDISRKNYLSWTLDAEVHLASKGLGETIKAYNEESEKNRAKALIFIRHHLHDDLKIEYLTVKDPRELWNEQNERFDHQRTVTLPRTRHEWMQLRLQDFKTVSAYNSELYRISCNLKLCGETITDEDLLEKTFSTFHASNVILQQQYRERGFKKYRDLISCLMVAEQNNELLLKNHDLRPTGSTALPKANATLNHANGSEHGHMLSEANATFIPAKGSGRDRGYNRGNSRRYGRRYGRRNGRGNGRRYGRATNQYSTYKQEEIFHKCGMYGHWSRTFRTPKHLTNLYQKSMKGKEKMETNAIDHDDSVVGTHLDVSDFFADPNGNFDHLIGGGVLDNTN